MSGVSDLSQSSTPVRVTSATGLQLLLSQDESRLAMTVGHMNGAVREVGRHILRLYRQFAGDTRLLTMTGENKKVQVHYFSAGDLSASDIVFETEEVTSPQLKRETLLKLLEAGVLTDDDGKISKENKTRFLEAFGFGSYENLQDITTLHTGKSSEENLTLKTSEVGVDEYDDHAVHVLEHTRFLLSEEGKKALEKDGEKVKARFNAHIAAHKRAINEK